MPPAKPVVDVTYSVDALPKPLDAKLAGATVAKMKAAGDAALKDSGKAMPGKSSGKGGYVLAARLTVLGPDSSGRKLNGKIAVTGMLDGSTKVATISAAAYAPIRSAEDVKPRDVDELGIALAEAAMKKLVGSF